MAGHERLTLADPRFEKGAMLDGVKALLDADVFRRVFAGELIGMDGVEPERGDVIAILPVPRLLRFRGDLRIVVVHRF